MLWNFYKLRVLLNGLYKHLAFVLSSFKSSVRIRTEQNKRENRTERKKRFSTYSLPY